MKKERFFFTQKFIELKNLKKLERCSSIFHIVGTNGKGSLSHFLEQSLIFYKKNVGVFTSPHLLDVRERIRYNGKKIPEKLFSAYMQEVEDFEKLFAYESFFFERLFLMSLLFFKQKKPDYILMEAGIGGRFDVTNILKKKICIIQSISFDHQNKLGKTITDITREKQGIIKKKNLVFISKQEDKKIYLQIKVHAKKKKAQIYSYGQDFFLKKENESRYLFSNLKSERVFNFKQRIPEIQIQNLQLTLTVLDYLNFNLSFLTEEDFYLWLSSLKGRFDIFYIHSKPVILDVAHNLEAMENFLHCLKEYFPASFNKTLIIGISYDKDYQSILKLLCSFFDKIIIVPLPFVKKEDISEKLFSFAQKNFPRNNIFYKKSFQQAYDEYQRHLDADLLAITGSFYLVGEALAFFKKL